MSCGPLCLCVCPLSEKMAVEKAAQTALIKAQILQMDVEKLQQAVTLAQRERDHEREEKVDALQERDRAKAETDRV